MTITYRTATANELTEAEWTAWTELVSTTPELDSPFYHPELTRQTSAVRTDVEVALIHEDDRPVGFFPYQRRRRSIQPVAGRLSECHGAVVNPGVDWSPKDLLAAARIDAWHFDHLPQTQTKFCQHGWGSRPAGYLDLSRGYEAYRASLKASGSSLSETERKARKMAREVGPLRFVYREPTPAALDTLFQWKSAQHRRTHMLEIFRHDWLRALLANVLHCQSPDFSAPLSALYAGEHLVALHLGLQTRRVLHVWFPAYLTDFERYSPGLVLLLRLAEEVASQGVQRIELGPGEERYKQNFKSADAPVYEGLVTANPLIAATRSLWYHTKRCVRQSKYRDQLEAPLVATRRLRQWMAFR